ncbi:hypothetical protein KQI65_12425 [bacterium]|nr:hypothetical protein [bacterium]
MKKRSVKDKKGRDTNRPARVPIAITISFVFLLLLWIVGSLYPEQRTWGFSHAAYVPTALAVTLFVLALLALLPQVAGVMGKVTEGLLRGATGKKGIGVGAALGLSAFAGLLFYILAIPFSFLGDSFLYLAEILRTADSGQVDFFRYNSLFSSFIFLYLGSKIMAVFSIVNVAQVFWIITAVSGAVFVFVLLRGLRGIVEDAADAAILVGLLLGLGGMLLFFGYVEYYAPLFAATLAYAMTLYRAVAQRESLVLPAIFLALSIALHFLALFYLPAFLMALYQRAQQQREKESTAGVFRIIAISFLLLFAVACGLVMTLGISPLYGSLIPLSQQSWTGSYTMLSSYHLVDLLNELLLVAAIPLALGAGLLFSKRLRGSLTRPVTQVFSIFSLSLLLLAFVHFPFYGMARDWDIYAPLGIALAFLLYAVLQAASLEHALKRYLAGVLVVWSAVALTLWVYTNVDEDSALQRYLTVLHLDEDHVHPDFAQYGYLNLRKYYQHKGDDLRSVQAFRKMIELRSYPWDISGFTNYVNDMRNPLRARDDIDAVRGLIMQKPTDSLLMSVQQGVDAADSSEYVIDQLFRFNQQIARSVLTPENIASFAAAHPDVPQCRLLKYAIAPPQDISALQEYISVYDESTRASIGHKPLLSRHFGAWTTFVIAQMYEQLRMIDSSRIWYARAASLDSALAQPQ